MVLQHESTLRRTSDDHPEHTGERDLPRYFSHVGQRLIGSSHLQDEVNSETWSLDYVGLASLCDNDLTYFLQGNGNSGKTLTHLHSEH